MDEPKFCRSVVHFQQKSSWDCGISCVVMVLEPEERRQHFLDNFDSLCQEENLNKSTWTIDLCYLLKRLEVKFTYTTLTLGVDPNYSSQSFYNRILNQDTARVNARFKEAAEQDITVKKESVDLATILEHIYKNGPCIVLTNSNVYACTSPASLFCGNSSDLAVCWARNCVRNYQGHYILVVGYDLDRKVIIYRNPSLKDGDSEMSFDMFEEARTSYGTDEDVIFIFR